ncbi:hypothetical protein K493DRAFT_341275 [Basidiobolus meristosporus CBS 931.73]|uniref:DUF1772-domain-containing protein n=1 Tax=Basidiobolus meristosporus CBS 931.73 TaxID=1314790 RepID=A0A1Y1XRQ3_9FUNG|nr:hypothetical protein K493DRAFT_341275 [Basidiobolus meristosporus CBS 931.73]|eukprot:ORX88449.1 hypothetical protein K493DRAFT_341275 [Basidiobolus meristosporus CBS 931.73]
MSNFDAIDLLRVLKAASLGSSGLFAGAALYITLAQQPAQMIASPKEKVAQFKVFYPRAAKMQAFLAVTCVATSAGVSYLTKQQVYLIPAGLFASVVGYTMCSIMPINETLLSIKSTDNNSNVDTLMKSWGEKHFVRTVLSTIGFGVILLEVFRR